MKFLKLGALKLQQISFSNFMTFFVSAFGLISTAFLYKFPLMQHVVRTVQKSFRRRASFIAGNYLHQNGETSRATGTEKQRDVYKKVIGRYHGAKRWAYLQKFKLTYIWVLLITNKCKR